VFELTGRKALVTGAGHGIGSAIALGLASAGADVVVHYGHSADAARDIADGIQALGRKCIALAADVTSTAEVNRLLDETNAYLGGLDILVCNAGHLVARAKVEQMSDEHFSAVLDVNLNATFRCVRAALPLLKESPYGRIITMSSLAAHNGGGFGSAAYAAAKAGVRGFTKALAKELAEHGITSNAVAPGFIGSTTFHDTMTSPETQRAIIAGVPLKRAGTADDVAGAVVWLASDAAGYVNGATIDIDGGAGTR
jgi:3-oxoacyl-[acyl-carrier protein] reductase